MVVFNLWSAVVQDLNSYNQLRQKVRAACERLHLQSGALNLLSFIPP